MIKTCEYCKKTFESSWSGSKYCSRDCYHKSTITRVNKTCPVCNKVFSLPYSARNRTFCSRKCYDTNRGAKITKLCPVCGKFFTVLESTQNRFTVCSLECRLKDTVYVTCKRCGKLFTGKRHQNRSYCSEECRRPPKIITCTTCKKEFRVVPSEKNRRFCSFACYRKFNGENLLEKRFRISLQGLKINFVQEAKMGRYSIDFVLPDYRIAIELDGEYWHDPIKDKIKTKYIEKHGWHVLRFTDTEINNVKNLSCFIIEKLNTIIDVHIEEHQSEIKDFV